MVDSRYPLDQIGEAFARATDRSAQRAAIVPKFDRRLIGGSSPGPGSEPKPLRTAPRVAR